MMKILKKISLVTLFLSLPTLLFSQKAYFIDGFHGGIWGHYPVGYTSYMVDQLQKHPAWNISLEIEPETWDRDLKLDVAGYQAIKTLLDDTTVNGRIEYVNPTYAQPYMFNISGESIIRQFAYGMKTLKRHFPSLQFKTYSSEEPCFTSALPQILKSFGYQYASLKNPNTAWGGYTRPFGKELVNWVGPDGSAILTSPRYQIESLKHNSTWETIGNDNNKAFIAAAFADGILNPIGMCLQDAGWRYGPWLKGDFYKPTHYTTWRNYFENIASVKNIPDWKFGQEDVLTSLVWGAQVLQQLAQQTRAAENNIIQAEKIAVIHQLDHGNPYPVKAIDDAWRTLMLAQHHDCWIVPYNGEKGNTWADHVLKWTNHTNSIADSIRKTPAGHTSFSTVSYLKVYNTLGSERHEWIKVAFPIGYVPGNQLVITDEFNKQLPFQWTNQNTVLMVKAKVPAFGYAVFEVKKGKQDTKSQGASIMFTKNGDCVLETDLYRIHIDKAKGGTIKSLVAKAIGNKEFIDGSAERRFNELRGNFYHKGGFQSNTSKPATIKVVENGPYQISVKVESEIAGNPVSQVISLNQGERLINCNLEINWKQNEGIGEFEETNYQDKRLHKAFYDDQYKLLTLFPIALKNQIVFKDAPFDVTQSKLENTFFKTWDSIKNNIVLSWVDIVDGNQKHGMTLFTDHTTSYAHGENFPLGLTTQYSGRGLWGRNYMIKNATKMSYQLLFHKGNWQQAGVSFENERLKEPLQVSFTAVKPSLYRKTFIDLLDSSLEISSCVYQDDELYVRVFNASKNVNKGKIKFNFPAQQISFMNLDGSVAAAARFTARRKFVNEVALNLKPFGITTLKISK